MLFNSFDFLIYLPIVFIIYWLLSSTVKWQNVFISIASFVFYGWLDWRFVILLFTTLLVTFLSGNLITSQLAKTNDEDSQKKAKRIMIANVVFNLAILGLFKYYNFFSDSIFTFLHSCGFNVDTFTLRLIMPIGISFYTFMALSYTIDIYKQRIEPPSANVFFAYMSFFPQLLSGPIGRGTSLIPQFQRAKIFDYNQATDGLRQFLWGLFKKAVIADNCATIVNSSWHNYTHESSLVLLIAGCLYSIQIYCDFSGYSDMAIGVGRLFGIDLMKNFNYPYFSRNIAEFWRRWHISLTSWFRDYIYIPLGGSREGKWKAFRNTMIIFTLCGFWHGANWTYIYWGAFNGLLFLPLFIGGANKKFKKDTVAEGRMFPSLNECRLMLTTFFLVSIGWIIFRADNITQAYEYVSAIFSNRVPFVLPQGLSKVCGFTLLLIVLEWTQRNKNHALEFLNDRINISVRWFAYLVLIGLVLKYSVAEGEFIYFQF